MMPGLDAESDDLRQELIRFGEKLLAVLYSPQGIAIRRLAIAEAGHSEIGKVCSERAMMPLEERVAHFLKKAMRRGRLRTNRPLTAAIHLLSLLDAEFLQRMLFGVMNSPKPEAIHAAVRRAVDAFLSGYQPADRVRAARAQQRRGVPRSRSTQAGGQP